MELLKYLSSFIFNIILFGMVVKVKKVECDVSLNFQSCVRVCDCNIFSISCLCML